MAAKGAQAYEIQSGSDTCKLMVAAIDFGTTYSSWAFSLFTDFKADPTRIFCKNWNDGKHLSEKAPTAVLIKPDGLTLEAFGYEAEDRYVKLAEQGRSDEYFYFRRFKMMLYENYDLNRHQDLEDEHGRKLPAMRVFVLAIRYLKEDLLQESMKRLVQSSFVEDEIQWVITVPAIWNLRAKQFMRECAFEAGIKLQNLIIALEPEVASLYCKAVCFQNQTCNPGQLDMLNAFHPGAQYMLIDAGGGTVDIVVHRVDQDGGLEEIYAANGGNWGGTSVDIAFHDLLCKIFDTKVVEKFKIKHLEDFLDLQREFDVKKRGIHPHLSDNVTIKVPCSLVEIYKKKKWTPLKKRVKSDVNLRDKVDFKRDKMSIDSSLLKGLFNSPISDTVAHIKLVLRNPSTINTHTILMVGGFAESAMLFEAIKTTFSDRRVFIPHGAGLAVLKGAVMYGHSSSDIKCRISPFTYGIKMFQHFNSGIHSKHKLVVVNGKKLATDIFKPLIHKGDRLSAVSESSSVYATPLYGEDSIYFQIFASMLETQYVDDADCTYVGELEVDCRDDEGNVGGVIAYFLFGGTEFALNVVHERTGKMRHATFNFLK